MHGSPPSVSIRRTFDPAFLNSVANIPAVHDAIAAVGVVDLSAVAGNTSNICLETSFGGFVLTLHEPGIYEVHSLFEPGHGTHPVKAMRAAMEWMFTRTDCALILSKIPEANAAAKGFALAGGLRSMFRRNDALLGPCDFVELDVMRWAMACEALEAHGERFHDFLKTAKAATGSALPEHDHDAAHERAVGAALLMIERGQAAKGITFYNRWARFAGYAELSLISLSPVTVDAVDAVVGLGADGMECLLCR